MLNTLLSVLVGAIISTGAQILIAIMKTRADVRLAERKEKADADKEKRDRGAQLRKAARLVVDDFWTASIFVAVMIRRGGQRGAGLPNVSLDTWRTYRETFAELLDGHTYETVQRTAKDIEQNIMDGSDHSVETWKTIAMQLTAGRDVLRPYME